MTDSNNSYIITGHLIHDPVISRPYPVGVLIALHSLHPVRVGSRGQFQDGEGRSTSDLFGEARRSLRTLWLIWSFHGGKEFLQSRNVNARLGFPLFN